jgi:hypothetical protein
VTSKTPAERALDILVFAPLGLALSARDLLPTLVEKGRQQLTGQVTQARVIGQFAFQQGSKEAGKAFERARSSAESTLSARLGENGSGPAPATEARQPTAPSRPTPPPARPAPTQPRPSPTAAAPTPAAAGPAPAPEPVRAEPAPTPGTPAPLASTLAIPAYDSLSASQVVPRLSGLSPAELEAVRTYEAAHRGRKTILNRVAQLQSA